MSKLQKAFIVCLVLVFSFSQITIANQPSEWHQNDWIKFVDTAVTTVVGEVASKVGSTTPITEVYSAFSALAGSSNEALRAHLAAKMVDAEIAGDKQRLDRYTAFYFCLTQNSCEELRLLQEEHQSIVDTISDPTRGYGGTTIDILSVPNDRPESVTTLPLVNGARYLLVASGVVSDWSSQTDGVDAVWCYAEWVCGQEGKAWQQLRINGLGLEELSGRHLPYNPSHVYAIEIYGTGEPLELHTWDAVDLGSYSDNSGEFMVEIRRLD